MPDTAQNVTAKPAVQACGALSGWRAISQYLGVCESTAREWSRRDALPVTWRPDGRVYITKSLIDQWLMAKATLRWKALENGEHRNSKYRKAVDK